MILFFGLWIIASIIRPVCLACLLACLWNPLATLRKIKLLVTAVKYLAGCHDKRWKEPAKDPLSYFEDEGSLKVETKTIIFVRHGESTWNDTFNKGDRPSISFILNFIPNLMYSIYMEVYFLATGQADESWFYDSALSEKGIGQALGVYSYLQSSLEYATPREAEWIHLLLGTSEASSQLVSSNLRRAISTMAIGFQDRLNRTGESILILPQLQEISRNPDALSIISPQGIVIPAWTDPEYIKALLTKHVDTSMHHGNKPVNSNGLKRMEEFCKVIFEDLEKDCVVVGGHSLWFRSFFRTYLPRKLEHVSKRKKLINGGCCGFVLKRVSTKDDGYQYMIDPASISVLHGGF